MISCMGGPMMNDQMRNRLFNHSDMVYHILSLPVYSVYSYILAESISEICRDFRRNVFFTFFLNIASRFKFLRLINGFVS